MGDEPVVYEGVIDAVIAHVKAEAAAATLDYVAAPRCRDCGDEIAPANAAFRPRCLPCHRRRDEYLLLVRAQERIENDYCFDERGFHRRARELNAAIVAELAE